MLLCYHKDVYVQYYFYEDNKKFSEVYLFLLNLSNKVDKDKNSRIQFRQITYCINLLENYGNVLPANIAKHIHGQIWELRP